MKTKVTIFGILILFAFVSASWGASEYISIATCGTAGTWFPVGAGLARLWNSFVPGVNAAAEASGCSVVNLRLIEKGEVNVCLVQNTAVYYAVNGIKFFDKKATKLRVMLMLYEDHLHVGTTPQTGIKSITDLKGKRLRVGFPGSTATEEARIFLEAYGITDKNSKFIEMSLSDSFDQIKDGNIDATMETLGYPSAGFVDLAHTRGLVLLDADKEKMEKISKQYPFLMSGIISAGTYKGQDKDIGALAVNCMVVVSGDLSTDTVYKLTKAVFEHLDVFGQAHARVKAIKLETALKGRIIPLHPGAEKYYREVGLIK